MSHAISPDYITPEWVARSPLPPGVEPPCRDCDARAVWLAEPAPNGARVCVVHAESCPVVHELIARENGAAQ